MPEFTDSNLHIVTGLLLPIWKRLPNESTRVYRLQTDAGERIIGRKVSPAWVATALATDTPALTAESAFAALMDGRTILDLSEGLQLRRVRVMGANRIEQVGAGLQALSALHTLDLSSNRIKDLQARGGGELLLELARRWPAPACR